jgi:hypothetical protein
MATFRELVKQSLLTGLGLGYYDFKHLKPAPIKGGLFADRKEIAMAESTTRYILQRISLRAEKGEDMSRDNLEKIIDLESALSAYHHAEGFIKINMAARKNYSKYVQEAREALIRIRKHGDSEFPFLARSFKQLIEKK